MDNTTKRLVCRMVAGIVVTDDDFSDTERAFVDRVLQRFEVPSSDWQVIFPLIDRDEAAAAMRSLAPDDQRQAFGLLLEAAMIDDVLAPEERQFLLTVGTAIGMDTTSLDAQLSRAVQSGA
jgi:hypothetical protein